MSPPGVLRFTVFAPVVPSLQRPSVMRNVKLSSVFGALAMGRHFDEPRIELTHSLNEVCLRRHDLVDVFVNHWYFVESGRNQRDVALSQHLVDVLPIEGFLSASAAHDPARAMGSRCERFGVPFATDEKTGRRH